MLTMVVESDKEKWECTEPRVTVGKLSFVGRMLAPRKWFSFNDEILFQQVLKRMPWTFKVVLTENNARRLTSLVRQIQVLNWASPTRMLMKREVKVNLFIPIMKLVFVKKHLSVDGKKCWVKFKFNFLPMICYRCGWWGHEEGGCEQEMVVVKEVKGKIVPLYGDWLKTDNPRKGCFDEGGRKYLNVRVVADSHHFANRVVVSNGEQQSVRMGGGIGGSKQLWWEGIGDRGEAAIIVDSCNSRNFIGNVAAKLQIQKESFKIKAQRLGIMSISEGMSRLEKGTGIDDYVISGEFSFA
uniref:CCHC-type domain-containing protein n=1 Tax=Cannabis sativa TaxID=3483 RepID=A0A803NPN9_CANSA